MKSYNNLTRKMLSTENVRECILKASLGKRNRSDVKYILENIDDVIYEIQEYLGDVDLVYTVPNHKPVVINDGISQKKRLIVKPTFDEQIVHHLLVSVTKDIIMRGMYSWSCGSIPGRGGVKAKNKIEEYINGHLYDGKIDYCLKLDVKHFFQNISHSKLKKLISKYIKDRKVEYLYYQIIDAYTDHVDENTGEHYGIPIGYYTSQWLANWYLQGLDHYIKEDLKAGLYIRYMDDMVIFGESSQQLHEMKDKIEWYLNNVLDLNLNGKWQVFKFDYVDTNDNKRKGRCLDFVGFRFFRDRTILRKNLMLKGTRKAKKIYKQGDCNWYEAAQMISSLGWFNQCDTSLCMQNYILPYINSVKLQKVVSKHNIKVRKSQIIDLKEFIERRNAA